MSHFPFSSELLSLGFNQVFQAALLAEAGAAAGVPARVACERRGEYELLGEGEPRRAKLSGRLGHELSSEARPAVGDWVLVEPAEPVARIHAVLPRRNVLRRRSVDGTSRAQALAANVDVCFVVCALAPDDADRHVARRGLNLRRLERYLLLARESGIPAVIVVNKADLASAPEAALAELARTVGDAEIELVSALDGRGVERLRQRLTPGTTVVLLGSSGVGKSTLVNRLVGRAVQRTAAVRDDDARGRHTTTERELLVLEGGGVLIDTPGMRELGLVAGEEPASAGGAFSEIDALAGGCRFRDCTHRSEPGCAVRAALERGALDAARLESARKLDGELRHERMRTDARLRQEAQQRSRAQARALRAVLKRKGRE